MDTTRHIGSTPATLAPFLGELPMNATGPDLPIAGTMACNTGLGVALIDNNQFSLECLSKAFDGIYPDATLHPYASVRELAEAQQADLGLILYHSHEFHLTQSADMERIAEIRRACPALPLVVLSDADDAQQPNVIRKLLEAGALGVVPTKTTSISVSLAVIRFVKAGGTFVPPDLLLLNRQDRPAPARSVCETERLTARQMEVFAHLNSGKANKLIAYELGMSESTVKVHVRTIMRKMKATNRTEAVYKARKIWGIEERAVTSGS